jgi:hypothetical protein
VGSNGRIVPRFVPGTTLLYNWLATRGAEIDITTNSFYVHDRWAANRNLTLDLGVRYERVRSEATGDIVGVDTDTWVPRLGATYDVLGNGRWVLQATYAHYAGKYSEAQFASNTDVGNPSLVIYPVRRTGRAGHRLRSRLRPLQLRRADPRVLPHGQRVLRPEPLVGHQPRVHDVGRAPRSASRLREADLRQSEASPTRSRTSST